MAIEVVYLVIGADRKIRAAKRPQVRRDEVAIRINLRFPDAWGRTVATLEAEVPDFAPVVATPSTAEYDDEKSEKDEKDEKGEGWTTVWPVAKSSR